MNNSYEPIVAKPNFCVPAVLQMVLKHCGVKEMTQDETASQYIK
jgi:hypothetical protein